MDKIDTPAGVGSNDQLGRFAFEARSKRSGYSLIRDGDEYKHPPTQHAWQGWMMCAELRALASLECPPDPDTVDRQLAVDAEVLGLLIRIDKSLTSYADDAFDELQMQVRAAIASAATPGCAYV